MESEKDVREYSGELLRIVEEFRQRIIKGTSDSENFMTISEIERLWSELRGDTSLLYSDMLSELLSDADESELIRKKNGIQRKRDNTTYKQEI